MNEVKITLKHLAVYFLLMTIIILPSAEIIKNEFPIRNISSIILITLSVCLFLHYDNRIAMRGGVKSLMLGIAAMLTLLFLLRGIKYAVFNEIDILARHTWYFYYVPILLIPQLFFFTALCTHTYDTKAQLKKSIWTMAVTCIFILLVLTNDLHQWVFRFRPQFENWDSDYSHSILFYLLTGWQYGLYLIAAFILLYKCRRSTARRHAYLILIPFLFGTAALVLLFFDKLPKLNGTNLFEFPEANGFFVSGILECCMSLGLIPTNESHRDLMMVSSVTAQITDLDGTPVYKSALAADLTPGALAAPSDTQLDSNTLLRKKEIPGGYGFWQEDMTELNHINQALAEAKERLSEESNLVRLQNELLEKKSKIEHRIYIYDQIAQRTVVQSRRITMLSEQGLDVKDGDEKNRIKKHIILLGVYIKRYANLMMIGSRSRDLNIAELGLSLAESLHYLEYYGVPGKLENTATGEISAETALTIFAFYEELLEQGLPQLKAVFIRLTDGGTGFRVKLNMEGVNVAPSEETQKALHSCGIIWAKSLEDGITYLELTMPKGDGNL